MLIGLKKEINRWHAAVKIDTTKESDVRLLSTLVDTFTHKARKVLMDKNGTVYIKGYNNLFYTLRVPSPEITFECYTPTDMNKNPPYCIAYTNHTKNYDPFLPIIFNTDPIKEKDDKFYEKNIILLLSKLIRKDYTKFMDSAKLIVTDKDNLSTKFMEHRWNTFSLANQLKS